MLDPLAGCSARAVNASRKRQAAAATRFLMGLLPWKRGGNRTPKLNGLRHAPCEGSETGTPLSKLPSGDREMKAKPLVALAIAAAFAVPLAAPASAEGDRTILAQTGSNANPPTPTERARERAA